MHSERHEAVWLRYRLIQWRFELPDIPYPYLAVHASPRSALIPITSNAPPSHKLPLTATLKMNTLDPGMMTSPCPQYHIP